MKLKIKPYLKRSKELENYTKLYNLDITKVNSSVHHMFYLVDIGFEVNGHGTDLTTGKQDFDLQYPSTSYKGESFIKAYLDEKKVTAVEYNLCSSDNLSTKDLRQFLSVLDEVLDRYGK